MNEKNFSLQQSQSGDYVLSLAYDLISTSIHISFDSFFGLEDGLFSDDFETESSKALGFYAYDDFYAFGLKIGMLENRVRTILYKYRSMNNQVIVLTQSSFLTESIKELYINHYLDRLKMLNNSFSKLV